jgi:HKD family nuclease
MKIQVFSNLNYPIGNIINQELKNAKSARFAVAFTKTSGLKVIEESLIECLEKLGEVELITGLDFRTTDPQALLFMLNLKNQHKGFNFFCFGDKDKNKTDVVYHPKFYLFSNKKIMTSIVGSTNLTGGGLVSNFEVNTVVKEDKPLYFSQLEAIYNSIKFTETVFAPDEDYILKYSEVYKQYSKNESKARKDPAIKKVIADIERKEVELPGTVPTMKQLIIEALQNLTNQNDYAQLKDIGNYVLAEIQKQNLNFNLKHFRQNLRKAIYVDLVGFGGAYNKELFETKEKYTGLFRLTGNGKNYKGR